MTTPAPAAETLARRRACCTKPAFKIRLDELANASTRSFDQDEDG